MHHSGLLFISPELAIPIQGLMDLGSAFIASYPLASHTASSVVFASLPKRL
jgi:hypothetical protein